MPRSRRSRARARSSCRRTARPAPEMPLRTARRAGPVRTLAPATHRGGRRPNGAPSMSRPSRGPDAAIAALNAWAGTVEPVVTELEAIAVERERLDALAAAGTPRPTRCHGSTAWAGRGRCRPPGLYAAARDTTADGSAGGDPRTSRRSCRRNVLLAVGPQDDLHELDATTSARKVRRISCPMTCRRTRAVQQRSAGDAGARRARARPARRSQGSTSCTACRGARRPRRSRRGWSRTCGARTPSISLDHRLVERNATRASLRACLDACGARALLHYTAAPEARVRRCCCATRAGPGRSRSSPRVRHAVAREADPSVLLADRGAAAVRLHVRRRRPGPRARRRRGLLAAPAHAVARLLMAGGLVGDRVRPAVRQRLQLARTSMPALWVQPLDAPLRVLGTARSACVLLTLGLALDALEAHWRGELGAGSLTDAAWSVVYLGLLARLRRMRALCALPLGSPGRSAPGMRCSARAAAAVAPRSARALERCCRCSSTRCRSRASAHSRWRSGLVVGSSAR